MESRYKLFKDLPFSYIQDNLLQTPTHSYPIPHLEVITIKLVKTPRVIVGDLIYILYTPLSP